MNGSVKTGMVIIGAIFFATALMAGTEAPKTIKIGPWTVNADVRSVPAEHRAMIKATHHVSIFVKDAKGVTVSDAKVLFEFVKDKKVVAKGEAKFMSSQGRDNMNMGHGSAMDGHYGADITLPGKGFYNLNLTITRNNVTQKGSIAVNAPE